VIGNRPSSVLKAFPPAPFIIAFEQRRASSAASYDNEQHNNEDVRQVLPAAQLLTPSSGCCRRNRKPCLTLSLDLS
jgi:hypothetical protein